MVLYDITDKYPEVLGDITAKDHYTDADIAAANFITTMSNILVKHEGNGHYSEYNEIVDMLIKAYPRAVKLILSLKRLNDSVAAVSKYSCYLVEDYLNGNFEKSHNNSFDVNSGRHY